MTFYFILFNDRNLQCSLIAFHALIETIFNHWIRSCYNDVNLKF